MSKAWPETRECPSCGLVVLYHPAKGIKSHQTRAIESSLQGWCAESHPTPASEAAEARWHQDRAAKARSQFYADRDRASRLPKGFR